MIRFTSVKRAAFMSEFDVREFDLVQRYIYSQLPDARTLVNLKDPLGSRVLELLSTNGLRTTL
jgi:hypothetical protein